MSKPASSSPWFCPTVWLKPHLTPLNIVIAAALGGATAGFVVLVTVLLIIATNVNVLGAIE